MGSVSGRPRGIPTIEPKSNVPDHEWVRIKSWIGDSGYSTTGCFEVPAQRDANAMLFIFGANGSSVPSSIVYGGVAIPHVLTGVIYDRFMAFYFKEGIQGRYDDMLTIAASNFISSFAALTFRTSKPMSVGSTYTGGGWTGYSDAIITQSMADSITPACYKAVVQGACGDGNFSFENDHISPREDSMIVCDSPHVGSEPGAIAAVINKAPIGPNTDAASAGIVHGVGDIGIRFKPAILLQWEA